MNLVFTKIKKRKEYSVFAVNLFFSRDFVGKPLIVEMLVQ